MTALGNFTAGDVLLASDLNAIGTWTSWNANFRAQAGAYTSTSTEYSEYVQINKLVIGRAFFKILNHTGGSSSAEFDLPVTANVQYGNGHAIGTGRENALNGYSLCVFNFNGDEAHIRFYDNGDPSNNNYSFGIVIAYEAA